MFSAWMVKASVFSAEPKITSWPLASPPPTWASAGRSSAMRNWLTVMPYSGQNVAMR